MVKGKNARQVERGVDRALDSLNMFYNRLLAKDTGFDMDKIKPLWDDLRGEVAKQGEKLIKEANKKPKPRNPKKILEDIAAQKDVTPELLDEINRALNKSSQRSSE